MQHMPARVADLISEALSRGEPVDERVLKQIMSLRPGDISPEAKEIMLRALSETNDARLRNVLAMTLASINSEEAADRIVALIGDKKTQGYRGTLLYALQKLRRALPLPTLAFLILTDTPEVQEEAFEMLRDLVPRSSSTDLEIAILLLANSRQRNEPERQAITAEAHDLLLSRLREHDPATKSRRSGSRH